MPKIAIIGDRDSVWGFKALGVDTYFLTVGVSPPELLQEVLKKDYAVVFITEDLYQRWPEIFQQYQEQTLPAITIIPNIKGGRGIAEGLIRQAIRSAIGTDIA